MKLNEISKQKWRRSVNLEVTRNPSNHILGMEQECHINILKYADDEVEETRSPKGAIAVCCSFQKYITILAKSEFFTLDKVLVSSRNKDYVLQVQGWLDPKAVTIRRKKHHFSKGERQRRAVKAKENFGKSEQIPS